MQRKTSAGANLYYIHTDLLGSIQAISNASGVLQAEYAYTPWGGRITLKTPPVGDLGGFDRGYTGHEHLSPFGDDSNGGFCLINMNGRIYDPVLARFLSPDPYVQAPDYTQSFNRYAYCWNNPFRYTDPSGELIYVIPGINWSRSGGLSISLSAGFGLPGAANIGITLGYGFSNNNFSATINGSLGGGYLYAGYDTKGGFIAGAGFGFGNPALGVFSTNMMNVGINYSSNGGWSGNYLGVSISKNGAVFDPSFGASLNFKWGTEVNEYVYDFNGELENQKFAFQNDYELNQFIDKYINKEEYGVLEITAYKENFRVFESGNSEFFYYRDKDGIIYKSSVNGGVPFKIGGVAYARHSGLKTYTSIYMSRLTNRTNFIKVLNHELTHAYHNFNGYRNKMSRNEYKRFTESSAYYVSDGGLPKTTFHSQYYNGIYPLVIPPRLIPVPNF